jgi:H+/Cl- antiporter ClcA
MSVLLIVAVLYIYGVILGVVTFVPSWALRGSWPEWAWWEYLVVPLALGLVALLLEWAFAPIPEWLEWGNKNAPQWKRAASFFLVFFGGVALIAISMFIQQWWEG